jgi:dTDP-4-dehydrorhamnose 3,5-epimerase
MTGPVYKCTNFYFPEDEHGIIWNDPDVSINWPVKSPLLSSKDKLLPRLSKMMKGLITK